MDETHQKCQHLLQDCHNHLPPEPKPLLKKNHQSISFQKRHINHHSLNGLTPQELEDNDRIIQKMRKKYTKKEREASIKKTNLGEDLLTFTEEEYARLQMIDECHQRGIKYVDKVDQFQKFVVRNQTVVECLKRLGNIDQIREQVRRNLAWGEFKENESVDCNKFGSSKKKGFQKRKVPYFRYMNGNGQRQMSEASITKNFAKRSLNQYYLTLLNKKTFGRKKFLQSHFDSSQKSQSLSFAQKLQIIKEEATRSSNNICKDNGPYMTNMRRQAIFSCQVLRYAKKILQPLQFQNLQLEIKQSEIEQCLLESRGELRGENQQQSYQAKEILTKNMNRIKVERKRVIEKMVC